MKRKTTISAAEIQRQLAAFREEVAAPPDFRATILKRLARETGQAQPQPQPHADSIPLWRRVLGLASLQGLVPLAVAGLVLAFGLRIALRPLPQIRQEATAPASGSGSATGPASASAFASASGSGSASASASGSAATHPSRALAAAGAQAVRSQAQLAHGGAKAAAQTSAQIAAAQPFTEVQGERVTHAEAPLPGQGAAAQAPEAQRVLAQAAPQDASFNAPHAQGSSAPAAPSAPSAPSAMPSMAQAGGERAMAVSSKGLPGSTPEPSVTAQATSQPWNSQVRRNRFLASRGEYAAVMFNLQVPGHVRIEAWDRNGRLVAVIHDADHAAGSFEADWYGYDDNGQVLATGIYLVRVKTDQYDERHKAVLIR